MVDLQKLLKNMTVREKIGQLTVYNANLFLDTDAKITGGDSRLGLDDEDLATVGSVLNYKSSVEMRQIQKEHLEKDRNKIPILFMMDVIHGYRTIYPIPLSLGCSFDPSLVSECTKMATREAVVGGIHGTYAPMVDYVRDARWGRVMESCGEDPLLNGIMGATQVKAYQGDNLKDPSSIASCVKHFAAYGGAEAGRDYNDVELSDRILREYYLPAYKACIDAGVAMLMPSFNVLNGVPATANSMLMKQILKDEWNFNGVVISDYNAIGELIDHGVAKDAKEAAKLAFQNNCDIEMCSSSYFHHMEELIEEGIISKEKLDEAVLRVLTLKEKLGLFENPYRGASKTEENEILLSSAHRDIARRGAEESAVLLKNNGVLPLSKEIKKIALIGPFADNHNIIGFWSCNGRNEESVTIYEGIKNLLPECEITVVRGCSDEWDDFDTSEFQAAIDAASNADAVILCLGEPQDYSGEGNSRADISLHKIQLELAKTVIKENSNTACVTFSGRPLALTELDQIAPAILHLWFPGTEGGNACANLLFGNSNPSGKLSISFPEHTGQCPIYYNHTPIVRYGKKGAHHPYSASYIECENTPLYSFGHGLSYSDFQYESLTLSKDKMSKDETVDVHITIHNNSPYQGKETVMLYLRDMVSSCVQPIQKLMAFQKVSFDANERKTIHFSICESMLRFWNNENKFVAEPGVFQISTGYADHLILTKELTLCDDSAPLS